MSEDERTPRTWPANTWPTAAELADWLSRCTVDERLSYADHAITAAQRAAACVDQCHADRLAEAESNVRLLGGLLNEKREDGADLQRAYMETMTRAEAAEMALRRDQEARK